MSLAGKGTVCFFLAPLEDGKESKVVSWYQEMVEEPVSRELLYTRLYCRGARP